jgi:hypothetical protein
MVLLNSLAWLMPNENPLKNQRFALEEINLTRAAHAKCVTVTQAEINWKESSQPGSWMKLGLVIFIP